MPKTKFETAVFTAFTSGVMILIMGIYNVALHHFPLEWLIGFLGAFFLVGRAAKYLAFRIVRPDDRPILILLCIQTFTVCLMVPLMSLVGAVKAGGVTAGLPFVWLQTICVNFIMAYPLQIFLASPLCRRVFGVLFRRVPAQRPGLEHGSSPQ